jgi:hypothetical protein
MVGFAIQKGRRVVDRCLEKRHREPEGPAPGVCPSGVLADQDQQAAPFVITPVELMTRRL